MPERESRGEMTQPRKRAEKLVEVTPEYPEKLPKRIASIVKRFEPFEDLAIAAKEGGMASLDVSDLMQMEGVLGPELVTDIESGGKMLRAFARASEGRMATSPEGYQRFVKFVGRMDQNTQTITQRLMGDRRPVAARFVVEMTRYSLLLSIAEDVSKRGLDKTVAAGRNSAGDSPEQMAVLDSVVLAKLLQPSKETPSYAYSHNEAFELLRDGAYAPTSDEGVAIDVPGLQCAGRPVRATLHAFTPQSPLALGILTVSHPETNERIADVFLSRVTGELIPGSMSVVSAEGAFSVFGNSDAYKLLRDAAFNGFMQAIDDGEITEEPYMTFDEGEVERLTYRQPKVRGTPMVASPVSVAPVQIESAPGLLVSPSPELPVSAVPEVTKKVPEVPRVLSVAEQIAEMNKPREKKDARVVWYESRITWRRVTRALRRLGVSVELKAHTKLELGTRKTDYLNPHDTDPQHCKNELFRVLDDLAIDYDTFFAVLK